MQRPNPISEPHACRAPSSLKSGDDKSATNSGDRHRRATKGGSYRWWCSCGSQESKRDNVNSTEDPLPNLRWWSLLTRITSRTASSRSSRLTRSTSRDRDMDMDMDTATYDLLVVNGVVVTDQAIAESDVAVKDGVVVKLAPRGASKDASAKRTIDAEGGYVMPGGVDAHVHLEEPALFGKGSSADTYETGSRSAICGGTTTLITFAPQTKDQDTLMDTLHMTHAKAVGNCYTDYSFHSIVANPSARASSEFPSSRAAGISSSKIYMTYAASQLADDQILDVSSEARRNQITTMIHAENGQVIEWMTKQSEQRKMFAPKHHATSHPPMAEMEATYRAICSSTFIDVPILIVHVSSPAAAAHIRQAQEKGLPVYAETCPQYSFLTREDSDKPGFEGAKCVCSPPPREASDHEAIWEGLRNGTFTVSSSDHCPFLYDNNETGKKSCITDEFPVGHFKYVPNGCPGVETRLALAMSEVKLESKNFVTVTSTNAAKSYGVYPKKGALLEGVSDADMVIWYPPGKMAEFESKNEMSHHNVDYTPYEGRSMKQWPRYTISRGEVVWDRDGGGLVGGKGGKFLERGPSTLKGSVSEEEWDVRRW